MIEYCNIPKMVFTDVFILRVRLSFLRDQEDIKGEIPEETRLADRESHTKAERAQL